MQPTSEMQFGRTDSPSITIASAFLTGQVTITVQNTEVEGHACDNELTLGQVIQLRDFLNRHIDSFALSATGSLAQRAADDSTQLASEELLQLGIDAVAPNPAGKIYTAGEHGEGEWVTPAAQPLLSDAPAGVLHLVWNVGKTHCVGFYDRWAAEATAHGSGPQHCIPAIGVALREEHILLENPLSQTTVTFY